MLQLATEHITKAPSAVSEMDEKLTATYCNTLQHTATHCNTLQHTATHYNTLQHTATYATYCAHIRKALSAVSEIVTEDELSQWLGEPDLRSVCCSMVQCVAVSEVVNEDVCCNVL